MKFEIFKFKKVTSTNDEAINLIKNKKKEVGCIFSKTQTKGKGTKGKKWISEVGNLFGSFFFPLEKKYPPFNEFSIINPIIVSDVIRKFCKKNKVSLKWPNDVFVNEKKICGILQEVITINKKRFLIVGIGINIISSPDINGKYETTNIFNETRKKPNINKIINLLIVSYEKFFLKLNSYNFNNYKVKAELMSTTRV